MIISIIVPIWNASDYLDCCLSSIAEQTTADWECLMIDDGSEDESALKCEEWCRKDPRFKYFRQDHNGVSSARNKGLDIVSGEWVCFIDADDWLDPEYLEKMCSGMQCADLIVSGQIREYTDNNSQRLFPVGSGLFSLTQKNTNLLLDLESKHLLSAPHEKLFKVSVIQDNFIRFSEECSYGEDLLFNCQYLEHVKIISTVDSASYHFRIHEDSLSRTFRVNQFEEDYAQWLVLMDFHKNRDLWNNDLEVFLIKRLWGIVYDGIFLYPKLEDKSIKYLSGILSIPEIDLLNKHNNTFECVKWIKFLILNRQAVLFFLYFKLFR